MEVRITAIQVETQSSREGTRQDWQKPAQRNYGKASKARRHTLSRGRIQANDRPGRQPLDADDARRPLGWWCQVRQPGLELKMRHSGDLVYLALRYVKVPTHLPHHLT